MRSYIVLSGIPVHLLGQKWKRKHQFMALKKKERKKKSSCNDSGKVQSQLHFPQADLTIILTLWTPDPRPGFEFGFVYFFLLGSHFGLLGHLLLVTGLPPLACTSNEVLVPHTALGGWSLRSPSPQPEAGVSAWGPSTRSPQAQSTPLSEFLPNLILWWQDWGCPGKVFTVAWWQDQKIWGSVK